MKPIVASIADETHKKMKINAAKRGMTIKDYLAWLLENDDKELNNKPY